MEFVIPLTKDDLLKHRSGQYYVKDITSARGISAALDATRPALANEGPSFILKHFDDFFSVLTHGDKLEHFQIVRAFDRLAKALEILVTNMEKNFPTGESRAQYLCINKMYVYLLCSLMCLLEDKTSSLETNFQDNGKKKKNAKAPEREEWEPRRDKSLLSIHRWLQLPLQNLWTPPIVEEAFVQLIADVCYKTLEHDKENKGKSEVRTTIFQILGVLVKRYLHNITCTIKIIQLVKMHEALGPYLAQGVVEMVSSNDCPGFIAELAREIEQTSLDDTSARNVSSFLEAIATIKPELVLPILDNITDYLSNDCYSMRNCAINVLGVVIIKALTGENLTSEQRAKRNECFDRLEAHTRDINTYVRSKVFQVLQKLCCEQAIPVDRFASIIRMTVSHLREKAATVRKQALVLLRVLLEGHPFNSFIDKREIEKKREEFKSKYDKMQEDIVAASGSGHEERLELWKTLSPEIVKAIKDCIADQEDQDSESEDEEDEEDDEEKYEQIRKLIIQKNFHAAVKKLVKITRTEDSSADILDDSEKERAYLHMMLFIFMESSKDGTDHQETTANFREQVKKIISLRKILVFFTNAETFATEIENALIQIELMLFSPTVTVAVEACTLLSTALTLKIPGADAGIRKALSQVFSREESVRNNVATIYRDIYLMNNGKKATISSAVTGLINLFKGLQPGQSPALAHLIAIWLGNKDLTDDHLLMIWHTFAKKTPGATVEDSRSAILLLAMAAQTRSSIISANIDVLVDVGLKTEGDVDLLLSRDCCRALLAIKTKDVLEPPVRHFNDHKIFENLSILLKNNFETVDVDTYVSFAHDAISVIYHLANQPEKLIRDILKELNGKMSEPEVDSSSLAKLLYIVAHAAMRHMVYLDTAVYKESKRRNTILEAKKGRKDQPRSSNISVCSSASTSVHSSARKARRSIYNRKHKDDESTMTTEDAGEEALGGATADDAEAEAIETELESNIISGNGFFAHFVPLVIDVCQYPEKYKSHYVQAFGVQALTKMMAISAGFCQQHLQLLFTILERSTFPEIRGNILMGLADLMTRFPNEVEPWAAHLYGRLRDREVSVRSTAVRVLASLVKREMIRVKGQMSEMALCIVDENQQIRLDAKQFFDELSHKGNVLYNILPDILSRLTSTDVDIQEDNLHEIVKHILGLLSKEKESDALLDKICQRLKMATTDRQCRDLAYCLSLLQLGKKGIATLISKLPLIKNKLHIREVQKALKDIVESARKKAETRETCGQLESEIEKLLNDDEEDNDRDEDREAMPPPAAPPKRNVNGRRKKKTRGDDSDEEVGENEEDDENVFRNSSNTPSKRNPRARASSRTPKRKTKDLSPEEGHENETRCKRRSNSTPSMSNVKKGESGSVRRSLRKNREESFTDNPPPKRTRTSRK
ncbi:condensin complex subunit 1 [Diachasma alloeum]|uniref:condensin complex subunit 1 n=1 Tax=Diachasma alloeum TaxID=454923 RepID=UPI0007380FFF|nr:condensin complex subunit 1 [Diachasma alloeum]